MERRVIASSWEKVTSADFNKLGTYPQASFDTVVGKMLIPDIAFEGFSVLQSGPAEITVSLGHLFYQGKVYVNDQAGGTTVDLLSKLPAATRRIVAVVVYGTEVDTDVSPRTFLTDPDSRATVAQAVPTTHLRWANVSTIAGTESPDPQVPVIGDGVCPVAYVTLTTTGVEGIVAADEYRTPTLREEDDRLNVFDAWRFAVGSRLDTLAADLLALAARIYGLAPFSFVRRLAADVGRLKLYGALPQTYVDYAADEFITTDYSQTNHVDFLCTVDEGGKFPPANESDDQLGLLNIHDSSVINSGDILLPAWTPVSRLSNLGTDVQLSISQYQYQTISTVEKTMTRMRYRYGPVVQVCGNSIFQTYPGGHYNLIDNTFRLNGGEVFEILETTPYPNWSAGLQAWWNQQWGHAGEPLYGMVRMRERFVDYYEEPYWEAVVINHNVSGAIVAQTFLNSQDGWLSAAEFYFSQVASTGDVTCLIVETTNGAPDPRRVIAKTTVAAADLKISPQGSGRVPTRFNFLPTYLTQGRYAFVLVTSGDHYLWTLQDTNYISGTLFFSTDGDWFLGDPAKDIAFEAFFCKFTHNTTQTQLLSLQLDGGIALIDVLAQAIIPASTRLFYEVQVGGTWYSLDDLSVSAATVLNTLPPLLPFRVNFVGTDSVQPCLGVAANSRVRCSRPRSDFRHISTVRTFASASDIITVDVRLEHWRGAPYHTFAGKLLYGGGNTDTTSRDPDVTTTEADPNDPDNNIIYHFTWNGMGELSACRFRFEGTTDNVLTPYLIGERIDIETHS